MQSNKNNVVETVKCKDFFDLVRRMISLKHFSQFICRGESSSKYQLVPSALRYEGREKIKKIAIKATGISDEQIFFIAEASSIFYFYQKANRHGLIVPHINDLYTGNDINFVIKYFINKINLIKPEYFEVMALAQHYGIPTRFLDWSYNFPTALFFAVYNALKKECEREKKYNRVHFNYIKDYIVIWALNKSAFEMEHSNFKLTFITPPYYYNENLKAQEGLFSYLNRDVKIMNNENEGKKHHGYYVKSLDKEIIASIFSREPLLYRFMLPYHNLPDAYEYLRAHNYTYSRFFPGYANIVQELHEEKEFMRLITMRVVTE